MTKTLLALMAIGFPLNGLAQTLSIPGPSGTQCIGTDCKSSPNGSSEKSGRGSAQDSGPAARPSIPALQRFEDRNLPDLAAQAPGANPVAVSRVQQYPKTEFQKYVQSVLGMELPIFGREFFENVPTTFSPVDRVPVKLDYVIGPGDQLLVRAWGKIDLDARVFVDRTGQIYLPRVGAINVAGVRYDQVNGVIHSAIGRFFKDFDVNVNIGQLRSIQIFVLGYAQQPGTYTISSLSTLMNALFESGGPASNGSMRHVQLKRNNTVVTDLDVYDLILKGDSTADAGLQTGDVIYIPRVGPQVAISGSVHRAAIYELRQSPQLNELVEDAGGITSLAGTKRVSLERVREHAERTFDEFALDSASLLRELKDGDIVRIYPVSPRIGNAVTLRGNVAQPGRYLWHEGMKVSDLVPSRDALITRGYWNARNNMVRPGRNDDFSASRTGPSSATGEQMSAMPKGQADTPSAPKEKDLEARREGEDRIGLKRDSRLDFRPTTSQPEEDLAADIRRRASDINWEYAVVERTDTRDLTTQLEPFNLGNAIDQPLSKDNLRLLPGDVVTIFSQRDIPVSSGTRAKFVQVEGEVKAPGLYRVGPAETLREVVVRAGGLSSHAYLYGSELHRESTLKIQQKRQAEMIERMERELTAASTAHIGLTADDRSEERLRIQEQRDFIAKLAQVQPSGRVVLELRPADSTVEDIPAMVLEDGDKFFVPAKLDTIEVFGAVYNESAFRFRRGKPIPDYLRNAGGLTRAADKGREFVIRADGTVISRQQNRGLIANRFESMRLMPGDAIVVPARFKTAGLLRGFRDWSQIFAQLALGAGTISLLAR
ncbi:MAG TPA: SLBB domain-containing protein [Candidatus Saccharimonadales bacterium]|jgi:polysaccharide export outer membrane protein|nr:SLBB domain-containing protein [Candidatus Saccharimonadales bacterium]